MNREEASKIIKKEIRHILGEKTKLSNFLEENNAKGKFIKNFTNNLLNSHGIQVFTKNEISSHVEINYNVNFALEIIRDKLDSHRPINHAFCWGNTPQGHDYWSNLNEYF